MTIIAWDGKTLAADRQITDGGSPRRGRKAHKLKDGTVIAWCGPQDHALEVMEWFRDGKDRDKYPEPEDQRCILVTVNPRGAVLVYYGPYPVAYSTRWAWGCGAHYAIGAMAAGKSAADAARIAIKYDIACGFGVDVFHLS